MILLTAAPLWKLVLVLLLALPIQGSIGVRQDSENSNGQRESTKHYSQNREWVGADPVRRYTTGKIIYLEDFGGIPDSVFFGDSHTKVSYGEFFDNDDDNTVSSGRQHHHPSVRYGTTAKRKSDMTVLGLTNRDAFTHALASAQPGDVVKIQDGVGYTLLGGVVGENLEHVTIDIAGHLFFLFSIQMWPYQKRTNPTQGHYHYSPAIVVRNSSRVTVTSSSDQLANITYDEHHHKIRLVNDGRLGGVIDGNGKHWWNACFEKLLPDPGCNDRPKLFKFEASRDVLVERISLLNSPFWTMELDVLRAEVRHVSVLVDRNLQRHMKKSKKDQLPPMTNSTDGRVSDAQRDLRFKPHVPKNFLPDWALQPENLNTDGIDVVGTDIYVHNVIVLNDDDSICIKPSLSRDDMLSDCTRNVTVEDVVLTGFGATIGSVPPREEHSCVDQITFRNVIMPKTGKGIYVKSNASDCKGGKTAQITNILYENMKIINPFWWSIWIGPQAQHQPHTGLDGECPLAYPIGGKHCPTQGCVDFANITLRNIDIYEPVLSPGVVLGNETNPIQNLVFDNVSVHQKSYFSGWYPFHEKKWPFRGMVKCEFAQGECRNSHHCPSCLEKIKE